MTFAACTAGFATNTEAAAEAAAWGGAAGRGMVLAMALKPRSDRTLRLKLRQRRIRRRLVKTKKQEKKKKKLGFSWFFAESPPSFETRDPKRRFESLDWVDGWIFTVLPFDVFLHFGPWKY